MGRASALPKDLEKVRKISEKAGWSWDLTKGGHYKVRNPEGAIVWTVGGTCRNQGTIRSYLLRLRNSGCPGISPDL